MSVAVVSLLINLFISSVVARVAFIFSNEDSSNNSTSWLIAQFLSVEVLHQTTRGLHIHVVVSLSISSLIVVLMHYWPNLLSTT